MSYWEDALSELKYNGYIEDAGHKGEVFKVTKKGYDYYDKNISKK